MLTVVVGHHRFEWLYVTVFVSPKTGESFWYLSTGVSKQDFEAALALFAREAGAGRTRIIVLGLDNAGWHSSPGLVIPEGIRLVYLPPLSLGGVLCGGWRTGPRPALGPEPVL